MRFAFSQEQREFQKSVRGALAKECPAAAVRAAWAPGSGRPPELWAKLAELGVVGLTVPEVHGGFGGSELDLVLVLEETGRAALPAPIVEHTAVAVPLLGELGGELAARWLPQAAEGRAILGVGLDPLVADAHVADLMLFAEGGALHAVPRAAVQLSPEPSVDGARRLFRCQFAPAPVAEGAEAARVIAAARDRGALGAAAQLIGLARHLIEVTVEYVKVRKQFERPIGSFQAVKHHLANALLGVEFAAPVVYRAAYSVAHRAAEAPLHVSMAKAYASDAATGAAKAALQCHGAIGYAFEYDLHLWMKRAWALAKAWGDPAWHRARVGTELLGG
jgi:alkylation response protein AidB-like acyl-CoA dehydrogenase